MVARPRDGTLPRHTDRSSDLAFQGAEPSARQHVRRAGRPLERPAPQDGDLRLDRVRRRSPSSSAAPSASRSPPTTSATRRVGPRRPARRWTTSRRTSPRASSSRRPRAARRRTPTVRKAVDDAIAARLDQAARRRGQVALREGQREPDLQGRPLRARRASSSAATRTRRRSAIDPVVAAVDRVKAAQPERLRRRVRRRQRRQGALEVVRRRLQEGREALAADHAADPGRRLRRARRRRRPAAAGADRGHGDARPGRAAEPDHPDGRDRSARSSCSSASPSASTTRCSTCAASARRRRTGAGKREAVHTAAATSGRAVLVSGFTVMVAMAGMFLAGDRTFTALGVGAIMVVAVAMIGSVTVVPGDARRGSATASRRAACPFLHRRKRADGESRVWDAILTRVLSARPLLGRRWPPPCSSRSPPGVRRCTRCSPAPTTCRASSRSCRSTTASRPPSRAARSRPSSRSRPSDVTTPAGRGRRQGARDQAPSPRAR